PVRVDPHVTDGGDRRKKLARGVSSFQPVSPVRRPHVDPGLVRGIDPSRLNAATWKDQGVRRIIALNNGKLQIAIIRRVLTRLPWRFVHETLVVHVADGSEPDPPFTTVERSLLLHAGTVKLTWINFDHAASSPAREGATTRPVLRWSAPDL